MNRDKMRGEGSVRGKWTSRMHTILNVDLQSYTFQYHDRTRRRRWEPR